MTEIFVFNFNHYFEDSFDSSFWTEAMNTLKGEVGKLEVEFQGVVQTTIYAGNRVPLNGMMGCGHRPWEMNKPEL